MKQENLWEVDFKTKMIQWLKREYGNAMKRYEWPALRRHEIINTGKNEMMVF